VAYALLYAGAAYAPVSAGEYISLFGSLILVIAALEAISHRRRAAWMALLGLVLVWSLYLPTIVGLAHMRLSNQRLTLRVLAWIPSSAPLTILAREGLMHLSPTEITQLKNVGITGTVSYAMNPATYGSGKASRVLLLMQEPVDTRVELREPDATEILYVQYGKIWKMYPPNARTLSRTIRIQPQWEDHKQSEIMVELSTGARMGFSIRDWAGVSQKEK
jgi:hypothetical protein